MMELVEELLKIEVTETKILEFIISSAFMCFLSYIHLQLLHSLYRFKFSKKQETKFLVIFSLFQILNYYCIPFWVQKIFRVIFTPIILFFLVRLSVSQILSYTCILETLILSVDMLCMFFLQSENMFLLEIIKLGIIALLELLLLWSNQKKEFLKIQESNETENKKSIAISVLFLFIVILHIVEMHLYKEEKVFYILLNDICVLIFYLLITLSNIQKRSENIFKEEQIETLRMHNKTLNLCTTNVKNFENDFNSIMQDFGGYIKYNDFESLKTYYQGIMEEYKNVKSLSILNPNVINESAIYNIISNKYYLAKSYGIEVEMEFVMDFTKLDVKTYELARILGILLDNAIEATKICKEKQIYMLFHAGKREDTIKISNTYQENEIDLAKIFEKGFSTKERNRGFGLWEIKQILQRHSNLELYTHKENNIFWQELSIYHD